MAPFDGLMLKQGCGDLVEGGAMFAKDLLGALVFGADDFGHGHVTRRAVSSLMCWERVMSRPRNTVSWFSPMAMGPRSLMPKSHTMARAILVACLMSPEAPSLMSSVTIFSAMRPAIEVQTRSAYCFLVRPRMSLVAR
jgi:hypothetical protein